MAFHDNEGRWIIAGEGDFTLPDRIIVAAQFRAVTSQEYGNFLHQGRGHMSSDSALPNRHRPPAKFVKL